MPPCASHRCIVLHLCLANCYYYKKRFLKFKMHKKRLATWPDPRGELTALTRPPSWISGDVSRQGRAGKGGEGKDKGERIGIIPPIPGSAIGLIYWPCRLAWAFPQAYQLRMHWTVFEQLYSSASDREKKQTKKQYTINNNIQSICKIIKWSLVCSLQNKL